MPEAKMKIELAKEMDIGIRDRYEDRGWFEHIDISDAAGESLTLLVVADGIGGNNAGERAAAQAMETIVEYCKSHSNHNPEVLSRNALLAANEIIYREAHSTSKLEDMGTTATLAVIRGNRLYLAYAGDSRAYLVRGRQITQLTVDHTFAYEMVKNHKLSVEEAAVHPKRDQITRSLGYRPDLDVDQAIYLHSGESEELARRNQGFELMPGDNIVLCTDGLYRVVRDDVIKTLIQKYPPEKAAKMLVSEALGNKTDDNVTVVIGHVPQIEKKKLPVWLMASFVGLLLLMAVVLMLPKKLWDGKPSSTPAPSPSPTIPLGQVNLRILAGIIQMRQSDAESWIQASGGLIRENTYLQVSKLSLGDIEFQAGTRVLLDQETIVRISKSDTSNIPAVESYQGRMCVKTIGEANKTSFIVTASLGSMKLAGEAIVGIEYIPQQRRISFVCVQGECIIESGGTGRNLQTGQLAIQEGDIGILTNPELIVSDQMHDWEQLCSPLIVSTPVVAPTPTLLMVTSTHTPLPTPRTHAATATYTPIPSSPTPESTEPDPPAPGPSTPIPPTSMPEPSTPIPSTSTPEPSTPIPSTSTPEPSTPIPSTSTPELPKPPDKTPKPIPITPTPVPTNDS